MTDARTPCAERPRVVVVGSVNVDVVMRVSRIPVLGETVGGGIVMHSMGGKGANQAVAAARLGADVALVAAVGADADGRSAIEALKAVGVDCSLVREVPGVATGTALILVNGRGENIVAVAPGANACVDTSEEFRTVLSRGPKGVLLTCFEVPTSAVRKAISAAVDAEWSVIINPAPARAVAPWWPRGAILTPNEVELTTLTGERDARVAARQLADRTGCTVVATLGARGALICDAGHIRLVNGIRANAIDTTGAGDAFNGTLAVARAAGIDVVSAVEISNVAAACATEALGAQTGFVTLSELRRRMDRLPPLAGATWATMNVFGEGEAMSS